MVHFQMPSNGNVGPTVGTTSCSAEQDERDVGVIRRFVVGVLHDRPVIWRRLDAVVRVGTEVRIECDPGLGEALRQRERGAVACGEEHARRDERAAADDAQAAVRQARQQERADVRMTVPSGLRIAGLPERGVAGGEQT